MTKYEFKGFKNLKEDIQTNINAEKAKSIDTMQKARPQLNKLVEEYKNGLIKGLNVSLVHGHNLGGGEAGLSSAVGYLRINKHFSESIPSLDVLSYRDNKGILRLDYDVYTEYSKMIEFATKDIIEDFKHQLEEHGLQDIDISYKLSATDRTDYYVVSDGDVLKVNRKFIAKTPIVLDKDGNAIEGLSYQQIEGHVKYRVQMDKLNK